jgi:hypothetical protein
VTTEVTDSTTDDTTVVVMSVLAGVEVRVARAEVRIGTAPVETAALEAALPDCRASDVGG